MKHFHIGWYEENTCPTAIQIERTVNTCGSPETHLRNLRTFLDEKYLQDFLTGCILYWAEAERWDERNRWAVLASRKITGRFPELSKRTIPEETLRECYGFTQGAHRYLQNELFLAAMESFKKSGELGISVWFDSQEFVYADDGASLVPYSQYKSERLISSASPV